MAKGRLKKKRNSAIYAAKGKVLAESKLEKRATKKAKRLEDDIQKAWTKFRVWQNANEDDIREGQKIKNYADFREIYKNAGRNINIIKDEVRYQMSDKTALAYAETYKEMRGYKLDKSLKDIRKMHTHELAKMMIDEINTSIAEKEAEGLSKKDIRKYISAYYFGS